MAAVTCRYYQRTADGTLWAILAADGKPTRANGPLSGEQLTRPAPSLKMHEGEDATGWDLGDFKPVGRGQWTLWEGNQPYPTHGMDRLKANLLEDQIRAFGVRIA